jgi:5'-nucleotidase
MTRLIVFLITNDDGIDAPGISALFRAAQDLGERHVVAPCEPQSGCGHRVTTHLPLRTKQVREGWTSIDGTPADCVRVALHHVAPNATWVLSGINAGGNLGADIWVSGTVAAVRESTLHGKPGIALSQYIARGQSIDWQETGERARRVLAKLLRNEPKPGTFWNVNFPHVPPGAPEPAVVHCPVDPSPLHLHYRVDEDHAHYATDYHERPRQPGHDVDVCFRGQIAVSLVRLFPG